MENIAPGIGEGSDDATACIRDNKYMSLQIHPTPHSNEAKTPLARVETRYWYGKGKLGKADVNILAIWANVKRATKR